MRIAISGAANTGKSTLIPYLLRRWPNYVSPTKTYRDVIKEKGLEHSSKTSEESQLIILDFLMKQQEEYKKGSNVFFDRCTLDNLAYTMQANAANRISDEVTAATISLVRESLKNLDIIFWIPFNPSIQVVDDGLRDANEDYIIETNSIFEQLYEHYTENIEDDIFFPKNDCPAIVPMEQLTVDDRVNFVGEFIDDAGNLIEPSGNILSEDNIKLLGNMLNDQLSAKKSDEAIQKLMKDISNGKK